MTPITVLLVDDDDASAIEDLFSDDHPDGPVEVVRAGSVASARQLLTDGLEAACALVDLALPDATGTDAVEAIASAAPSLPIVALTTASDPEVARDALGAGAHDHLVKAELHEEPTRRAIRYARELADRSQATRAARRELRDFAHRISHDLKSPISVMLGALDLLQGQRPDDGPTELYDMLERSSRRLMTMLDRLVEFADATSSDEALGSVDLDEVLARVVEKLDEDLEGVEVTVERPLPIVHGNEIGLRHVLSNLLSNATKFTAADRAPHVTIDADRRPVDGHDTIVVSVTDNGRGVPSDQRAAVFDVGHRVDDSAPGTGLGLATVQRTMQLIGGRARIETGPDGVGTTVVLELRPPADTAP